MYIDDSDLDPVYEHLSGFSENGAEKMLNEVLNDMYIDDDGAGGNDGNTSEGYMPKWTPLSGRQKTFPFRGESNIRVPIIPNSQPIDIFKLFVTDEILDMIVEQTNVYA